MGKILKTNLKTLQNSSPLCSRNPRVFIGKMGYQETYTELRVESRRAAPYKSHGHVSTAVVWPCVRRRLPRAVASVPCQMDVLVSCFGPLGLTNQLFKVNG